MALPRKLSARIAQSLLHGSRQRQEKSWLVKPIANFGTLRVLHSVFSENLSISGGGIFNGGVLKVDHSTISQNTASSAGGVIYNNQGTMTLTHTSVTENTPDDIFP